MSVTVDCGEGKHSVCSGSGSSHYLIPQLNDGERFVCACPCHSRAQEPTPEQSLADRFHERYAIEAGGCWRWTGTLHAEGYGRIATRKKQLLAHRVSYELHVGAIPDGMTIDHLCRNRLCVNPAHLETVTNRENLLRGEGLSAQNARKTHCKHGHPYNEQNTYITPDGKRQCRMCNGSRRARLRARGRQ